MATAVALSDLFVQVLRLCLAAGLVQFAHVAVDGTKLKANASRHKAMGYGRMKTVESVLAAVVDAWLDHASGNESGPGASSGMLWQGRPLAWRGWRAARPGAAQLHRRRQPHPARHVTGSCITIAARSLSMPRIRSLWHIAW
jgi:hypothetical protein